MSEKSKKIVEWRFRGFEVIEHLLCEIKDPKEEYKRRHGFYIDLKGFVSPSEFIYREKEGFFCSWCRKSIPDYIVFSGSY